MNVVSIWGTFRAFAAVYYVQVDMFYLHFLLCTSDIVNCAVVGEAKLVDLRVIKCRNRSESVENELYVCC